MTVETHRLATLNAFVDNKYKDIAAGNVSHGQALNDIFTLADALNPGIGVRQYLTSKM